MLPRRLRRWLPKFGLPLVLALACTWLVSFGLDNSILNDLETKLTHQLASRFPPVGPNPAILFIKVDEESALAQGLEFGTDRLDRRIYGSLFEGLSKAGASVVLSDIIFEREMPQADPALRASMARATASGTFKIVLTAGSTEFEPGPKAPNSFRYAFSLSPLLLELPPGVSSGHALDFSQDAICLGGEVRRTDHETKEQYWHTALLAAWAQMRLDPTQASHQGERLSLGPWELYLGGSDELRLLWTEGKDDFPSVSLLEAQQDLAAGRHDRYRNRCIILADVRSNDLTQVHPHGQVPGSLVVANLVNTALLPASERMRYPSVGQEFAWVLAGCLLTGFAARRGGAVGTFSTAALVGVWAWGVPLLLAGSSRFVMSSLWAGLATALTATLCFATLAWMNRPADDRVEGDIMEATVLFSDLTDSTGLVQSIGAQAYQRLYGEWLAHCEAVAVRRGGILERTTGDGFIIVFEHRRGSAAMACLEAVREMASFAGVQATFGFESGPVSGGYVSESGRKVWSSSGTTVNLAKRLQSVAGEKSQSVLIGPAAARMLSESATLTRLGLLTLKGINSPVDCYGVAKPSES